MIYLYKTFEHTTYILWRIATNFHMFFSAIATNQTTGIYFSFLFYSGTRQNRMLVKAKSQAEKHEAAETRKE